MGALRSWLPEQNGRKLTPQWSEWPAVLLRLLLGGCAAIGLFLAAAILVAIGGFQTTGCFLECVDSPNPFIGIPLQLAGTALAVAALGAVWWAL